jgi:hypothetical protein
MATRNFKKRPSGSRESKAVGAILDEMLRSDSRFAVAYRRYQEAVDDEAEVETSQLFKDLFPDTHLCVDVKVLSVKPGRIPIGKFFEGYFTRNDEDKFLIIEKASDKKVKTVQRNPVIFAGRCVNVHLLSDGSKRLEFNRPRFNSDFSFRKFCVAAARELLTIARLLGEEDSDD